MAGKLVRIVLFGAGRLGRSLAPYFRFLGCETTLIDRRAAATDRGEVIALIGEADIVAAALPDDSLAPWHDAWKETIGARPAVHFSGTARVPGMIAYHPLYSFSGAEVQPAVMRTIIIARERGDPPFSSHIPTLPNPEIEIAAQDRARYHALAVLAGNFPAFVWNMTAAAYREQFPELPADALATYFTGLVDRFREDPVNSFTGPVARRDAGTVQANLAALKHAPKLEALYLAFLASAWPEWPETTRK
jgi:hypothetical protein